MTGGDKSGAEMGKYGKSSENGGYCWGDGGQHGDGIQGTVWSEGCQRGASHQNQKEGGGDGV